ncbi:hypothetical protein GIS00_13365 [Nakamurella sp. YIM 132087]|uniref:HTH luxR-type domain-containing protein n=1 Tax=Nakamurella alba TaxID=2665158 RepID=A0A7K1FNP1_9ACTN|nr:LuxR family transcriptional regulator [Nakamurella alba]MTD14929.1 hypothetical protein [Nakamurella alba]
MNGADRATHIEAIAAAVRPTPTAGRVIAVHGGPGVGTTSAVRAAIGAALFDAGAVVALRAEEIRRHVPFGVLAPLLPEGTARTSATLLDTVDELCAAGDLIVWIDDAQYVDPASAAALAVLADATRSLPLSLVLSGSGPEVALGTAGTVGAAPDLEVDLGSSDGPVPALPDLPDGILQLLRVLAVVGTGTDQPTLARLAGTSGPLVGRSLAPALAAGVVIRQDGLLTFAHARDRTGLLDDLSGTERADLHRTVAEVLAATGGDPALAAEHRRRAGDPGAVAALRELAADWQVLAPEGAADLLAQALVAEPDRDADTVTADRAEALMLAGRGVEAEDLVRSRLPLVRDPRMAGRMSTISLRSLVNRGNMPVALAEIEILLQRAGLPAEAARELRALRLWVLVLAGRLPEARKLLDVELDAVPESDRDLVAVTAQSSLLWLSGRPADALRVLPVAHAAPADADGSGPGDALTGPVWPAQYVSALQGPAAGLTVAAAGRATSDSRNARWVLPFHDFVIGGLRFAAGDWDDAAAIFDSALAAARDTGTGWTALAAAGRTLIDVHRGDLGAARDRIDGLERRRVPTQFGMDGVALASLAMAEAGLYADDSRPLDEQARGMVVLAAQAAWRDCIDRGGVLWAARIAPYVARLADEHLRLAIAAHLGAHRSHLPEAGPAADLAAGLARVDPATTAAAAEEFSRIGLPLFAAAAHEETGLLAARTGDITTAGRALRTALDLYHRLGAETDEQRLRIRAHRIGARPGGARTRKRPASGWEALTPTEVTVADMIKDGLTNPEIARRLFLSPRTVQTHVSHVLAKTGLRSRVEIAAALVKG